MSVEKLTLRVVGRPQSRGSKIPVGKRGGGIALVNGRPILKDSNHEKSKAWMQAIRDVAREQWGNRPLLVCPVFLSAAFYFARPKSHYRTAKGKEHMVKDSAPAVHAQTPDLSKVIRTLEDALTGVIWRDDRQVSGYEMVMKLWTDGTTRSVITLRWMDEYPELKVVRPEEDARIGS